MPSPGQQSLSNFYKCVQYRSPLLATLMSDDVITVAHGSMASDKSEGQEAANRLRKKSEDLPERLRGMLETSLKALGYS